MAGSEIKIFVDSGAFSAQTKGVKIDIDEYIKFIKEYRHIITVYSNLDDISDPEITWKNQDYMEAAGLNPLPVYHVGEPLKYLTMAMEYDYFAIGGAALANSLSRQVQYDNIFSMICPKSNDYYPTHKVHGFGMTSLVYLWRYPWYSVDSTSWVLTGRFGAIIIPQRRGGKYLYTEPPWKITVSYQSPGKKEKDKHFTNMSPAQQRVILDYIEEKGFKMGKSEFKAVEKGYELQENERWYNKQDAEELRRLIDAEGVFVSPDLLTQSKTIDGRPYVEKIIEWGACNDYKIRDSLNIIYFNDLEKNMTPWPWQYVSKKVSNFGLWEQF